MASATDGDPIDTSTVGAASFTETATDNAGNVTSVTNDYAVLSPAGAIDRLINDINALALPKGIGNALTNKLEAALASFDRGRDHAAVNQLNAFINQVNAQSGKTIGGSVADDLVSAVEAIIAVIAGL